MILTPSKNNGYQQLDDLSPRQAILEPEKADIGPETATMLNLIRTRQFFLLLIMMYLSSFFGYFMLNQYKDFGKEFIKDDHFLTLVGAIASGFSGFRFVWAFLMQKFSFKVVYSIMLLIQIVVSLTIYWTVRYKFLYLISICMSIWLQGGHFTVLPTVCGIIYGDKATQMFSLIYFSFGAGSLTGVFIVLVLLDKEIIGYLSLFIISAAMTLLCLIILHAFFKEEMLVISAEKVKNNETLSNKLYLSAPRQDSATNIDSQDKMASFYYFRSV